MPSGAILVVDDDSDFRGMLCRVIRAAGYAADEAGDGAQALRVIRADTPDLLITDILMPRYDGIELISEVRSLFPEVRILAISGRRLLGALDVLELATKLGAHATLDKPFDSAELFAKIEQLIGQAAWQA